LRSRLRHHHEVVELRKTTWNELRVLGHRLDPHDDLSNDAAPELGYEQRNVGVLEKPEHLWLTPRRRPRSAILMRSSGRGRIIGIAEQRDDRCYIFCRRFAYLACGHRQLLSVMTKVSEE
jgi:hypothetical protein